MGKKKQQSVTVVGASSLLVIFTVLCLTVFALLSLATARADARVADASAQAVLDYYAADVAAEERYAALRAGAPDAMEGVRSTTDRDGHGPAYTLYTYAVPIDDAQELQVQLRRQGDVWTVLRWKAVSTVEWTPDTNLSVWDGE